MLKKLKVGPRPPKYLKNRPQSASNSLPKTILESILEKTGPALSSTHYLQCFVDFGPPTTVSEIDQKSMIRSEPSKLNLYFESLKMST